MASKKTFLIKLGGEVITSPKLPLLAREIFHLSKKHHVVIVHGGGKEASQLQTRLGQNPHFIEGRRVTDESTLDIIKMVVAGKMNVDLCSALLAQGASPVGLHGASALAIYSEKAALFSKSNEAIDYGFVGETKDVNVTLLKLLLDNAYIPVLSCLGCNKEGQTFNINADAVANRASRALGADALLLISDVSGVYQDIKNPQSRYAKLSEKEAKELIAKGIAKDGMIPKLEESFQAIHEGVNAVFILGKLSEGDLERAISEPGTVGTLLQA